MRKRVLSLAPWERIMGMVYLVGAGPGDPRLISVRGLELIRRCDCLVYDRLVSTELLYEVSEHCKLVYVGKESGHHSKTQEEINEILLDCAGKYEMTVRLKGGDPFVFGRGGEEFIALAEKGYSCEVIPGISSSISVPESVGIPLTHRQLARSFHVITGHTKDGDFQENFDFSTLAKLEGTLVFLMGRRNLPLIIEGLLRHGKDKGTPVALISQGTTLSEQVVRGQLDTIVELADSENIKPPCTIVIGPVVNLNFTCGQKKKIGVIATDAMWKKLDRKLSDQGYKPCRLMRMQVEEKDALRKLIGKIEDFHWLVFSSQNAIHLFFKRLREQRVDSRRLSKLKFAVVGAGTAKALEEYGFYPDFIPTKYHAKAMAEELATIIQKGDRVLFPRAEKASPVLCEKLLDLGADLEAPVLYDVLGSACENLAYFSKMDALIFCSASGVDAFYRELMDRELYVEDTLPIVAIGALTASRYQDLFDIKTEVPSTSTVDGILEVLKKI